jgi:hypothetical protein
MGNESRRLLSHYVDRMLDEQEAEQFDAKAEKDSDFADRAGAWSEDDAVVRKALQDLHLSDSQLVRKIVTSLPHRPDPPRLSPPMLVMLLVAAGLFTAGTVLFQGTARMLEAVSDGLLIPMLGHVVSVVVGFVVMVWAGREAFRVGLRSTSLLVEVMRYPLARYGLHVLSMLFFIVLLWNAAEGAIGVPDPTSLAPWAHLTALLGLPLLLGLLAEAASHIDDADYELSAADDTIARWYRRSVLVVVTAASAFHYLLVSA